MKLQLLDIDRFIEKNNLKQVTTVKLYEKPGKTDPSGLFSEEIFGRFGSIERRKTFAYMDLRCTIIHPEAFFIITGLDTSISKLLTEKAKYIVDSDGVLVEDPQGNNGIEFFISIYDKLNLDKFKKNKPKNVNFLKANRKKIFIDKYIVLPAGIRDLAISKTSGQTIVNFSDLSELYGSLVRQINMISPGIPDDIKSSIISQIQKSILEINNWIKNRMKGKQGIIRGGLLKKITDYSGRLVITTDHTLLLGTVGLPWQVVLKLYEPFAINYILKKDASAISLIQQTPDINDLKRLFSNLIEKPNFVSPQLKEYLIHVANEIIADKVVIYKRDPVENKDSWLAANVRVDPEGVSMKLNPLDLPRLGGDHDGDQVAVLALFTKEAQEDAKTKMHPRHTQSMWTSVVSANKCPYMITLDAATAIYAATKQ
jgi:DNA-directed RNA polymerase beta' subunit